MKHAIALLTGNFEDERKLISQMIDICHAFNLPVVKVCQHQFYPSGFTAVLLLAESHFSIHTFPEISSAYVDIFTCNKKINPGIAIKRFAGVTSSEIKKLETIER